jgi:hypothetical protein
MGEAEVATIVYGAPEDPVGQEVVSAVEAQSRAPGLVIAEPVGLAAAVAVGTMTDAEWLWLLDGTAVPASGALEALLDAAAGVSAALLSGRVLDPDGNLDRSSPPRHVIYATDVSVAAAERHLVQLRAAGSGSVLIRREMAGIPTPRPPARPPWDMFEFSARILRNPSHTGYLVPGSLATRSQALGADPISELRALAGGAWTPREKLREGFLLTRRLAQSAVSSRRADPGRRLPSPPGRIG